MSGKKKTIIIILSVCAVVLAAGIALWVSSSSLTFPYTLAIANHSDSSIEIRHLGVEDMFALSTKITLAAEPYDVRNNKFPLMFSWIDCNNKKILKLNIYETETQLEKTFSILLADPEGVGGTYKLIYQNGNLSDVSFESFSY